MSGGQEDLQPQKGCSKLSDLKKKKGEFQNASAIPVYGKP